MQTDQENDLTRIKKEDSKSENETEEYLTTRPHTRQIAIQFAAIFGVLSLIWPYFILQDKAMPWLEVSMGIGAFAFILSWITRQPWWWRLIHAIFVPLLFLASNLSIHPAWFLFAFITTLLVYRGAVTGQVPLYLSNHQTALALNELIKDIPQKRMLDIGAGIGSIIIPLAKMDSTNLYTGIENAPATWLVGYLRSRNMHNCSWLWGDMWKLDLGAYNVAYAFLSPAPMSALWEKAKREMPAGSLFISNSFPIPNIEPDKMLEVDDARQTRLFCYKI